jgi:hypothetical protein
MSATTRRRLKVLPPCAAWFAVATAASSAGAVERENHLGLDAGGGLLVIGNKSTNDIGASLGAHYTYGLNDTFNLMVEASYSLVALDQTADSKKTPPTYPAWLANADVGIGYVFDVLQWVPYAGVLIGGYGLSGGTIPGVKILPGAEIALGLDYRLSSSMAVGVALRQHFVSDTTTYPSFSQALARVEYNWGW